MKKQLMLIVLILFSCFLTSCVKNQKNNDIPMYLHGSYHGECLYENPAFSSMILEKEFVFEENKYNDIIAETKTKINNFFVNVSSNTLPLDDLKECNLINFYVLGIKDGLKKGIYVFKVKSELYLFEANYFDSEYIVQRGYKLEKAGSVNKNTVINTSKNDTFFPTEKNDFHKEELIFSFDKYINEQRPSLSQLGEYELSCYTSEEIYNKYQLDIFEVSFGDKIYYYIKHLDDIYLIVPFDLGAPNSCCITHFAVTDINNDGCIEILSSVVTFADRGYYYYCNSFITVIDTKTKKVMELFGKHNGVTYFKENEDGVISLYSTGEVKPVVEDLNNGKLDEKYYDYATELESVPVLNVANYRFDSKYIEASCDLFDVEITIDDENILFPYIFDSASIYPHFDINVKMRYLGSTFTYTSPDGYLDSAIVKFVNSEHQIGYESFGTITVVTKFTVYNGMIIERNYRFNEGLQRINEPGVYDMVIEYVNEETGISDKVVIKEFLKITR